MEENKEIEILRLDGCTKTEAIKAIKNGTIVYDDFKQNIETYLNEWGLNESEKIEYRNMIKTRIPIEDWGIVEKNNKIYFIQYIN